VSRGNFLFFDAAEKILRPQRHFAPAEVHPLAQNVCGILK
jgi:hypothetical protein